MSLSIEAKLGLNVFAIDKQPHIVINQAICQSQCLVRYCLYVCPASLYSRDSDGSGASPTDGTMHVNYEGCLECGTCLIACPHQALSWHYPRGGFGVQYRFG